MGLNGLSRPRAEYTTPLGLGRRARSPRTALRLSWASKYNPVGVPESNDHPGLRNTTPLGFRNQMITQGFEIQPRWGSGIKRSPRSRGWMQRIPSNLANTVERADVSVGRQVKRAPAAASSTQKPLWAACFALITAAEYHPDLGAASLISVEEVSDLPKKIQISRRDFRRLAVPKDKRARHGRLQLQQVLHLEDSTCLFPARKLALCCF